MRITELAKRLNVSRRTIYNWVDNGKVKLTEVDGIQYIADTEAQRLIKEQVDHNIKLNKCE